MPCLQREVPYDLTGAQKIILDPIWISLKVREGQWSLDTGKIGGGSGVRKNGYQIQLGGNSSSDL
jgi:hypothetical protein